MTKIAWRLVGRENAVRRVYVENLICQAFLQSIVVFVGGLVPVVMVVEAKASYFKEDSTVDRVVVRVKALNQTLDRSRFSSSVLWQSPRLLGGESAV